MSEIDVLPVSETKRMVTDYNSFRVGDQEYQSVLITYPNGYGLSVIRGFGTYSGENLFEVAIINGDGELVGKSEFSWPDNIRGWQSEDDLLALEKLVSSVEPVRKVLT